jgi:hypothetical protein
MSPLSLPPMRSERSRQASRFRCGESHAKVIETQRLDTERDDTGAPPAPATRSVMKINYWGWVLIVLIVLSIFWVVPYAIRAWTGQ